LVFLTPD
jgi:hAT family C-terminal dimerisation region